MVSVEPSVGRDWNHELAAFRASRGRGGAHRQAFRWYALEPSDGRDREFGSIRWPRLRNGTDSPARTKLLINVSFHGKLYVCQRAHVQRKRRMRMQMTLGSGLWSRSGTFGLSLMARCRFVRVRACGPTAQPAPRGKAIAAMYFTVAAAGNAFRLYVPEELVADIQLALENGRRLKDLISMAGERYAHALKNQRRSRSDM